MVQITLKLLVAALSLTKKRENESSKLFGSGWDVYISFRPNIVKRILLFFLSRLVVQEIFSKNVLICS